MGYITKNTLKKHFPVGSLQTCEKFFPFPQHHAQRMYGGFKAKLELLTLILPRSRTGTVWFYTSSSNKRAARPKLYTKSLTRDLKLMYSRLTLVRIYINL